ncbi:MAG: M20 family metallo-hydrolase [Gemmatimonadota bacterium]|nr:MAG: M20 family metallo-hydrolase [Gemmatimonadota bacterium]
MHRRDFVQSAALGALAVTPLGTLHGHRRQGDWKSLRVNGARVNRHLADLSRYGRNPDGGVSRVAYSDADIAGREFAVRLMRAAELEVRIDPVGNIIGTRAGTLPAAKPILFGSHIDSVPHGGNYDGDLGSLSAIEAAHTLAEAGYRNRHPLEVVIWCDEESGLTGSRGYVGDISREELHEPGRDGVPLAEKIARIGGDPERLAAARHEPGSVAAYLELHVEQGNILHEQGVQIGVVEGIVGIHHYDVTIEGFANHAGTTPMNRRRNAMLTAAELVLAVDRIVKAMPGRHVGTVGRLLVEPGAPNVVPGRVRLTVELRDLRTATIEALWEQISAELGELAHEHDTPATWERQHTNDPALSDPGIRAVIAQAAEALDLSFMHMPSGAGHDAQTLAAICPIGMIFVPAVDGISHSPKEFTSAEDVEHGANVLLQSVLRLDQA